MTLQPWQAWALLGLLVLALTIVKWARRTPPPIPEVPPVEERPALPKSVRDRLAARERKPKMTVTAIRKRREWARLAHAHDQEEAEHREAVRG